MPLWEDAAVQAHTLRTHAGLALDLVSLDLQPTWAPYVEVNRRHCVLPLVEEPRKGE